MHFAKSTLNPLFRLDTNLTVDYNNNREIQNIDLAIKIRPFKIITSEWLFMLLLLLNTIITLHRILSSHILDFKIEFGKEVSGVV